MKPFILDSHMTTMAGVFYPTGHAVLMFPGKDEARQAGKALIAAGVNEEEMSVMSPDIILGDVARTVGNADMPLPSVGTEADTVRQLTALAAQGHWGLLVHAPHHRESDRLLEILKDHRPTYAQMYRQLVIEDL